MQITEVIILSIMALLCLFLFFPSLLKNLLKARRKAKKVTDCFSFESFCFEYLRKHWYRNVKQTQKRKDWGFDLIAYKHHWLLFWKRKKFLIECKYYDKSKIGVEIIRMIYAVAKRRNALPMLMYTWILTRWAKEEANYYDVKLVRFNK